MRHLLSIDDLEPNVALGLLDSAASFFEKVRRKEPKSTALEGKVVINLFFEPSTRTRTSFELAGKRLCADVINISPSTSSVTKGETLRDTVLTLGAMHADVMVIRHDASGALHSLLKHTAASIINAGDGMHEHPTQALLDAFTIRRLKGRVAGLRVAICGDVAHSRVARSNALLLRKLGAHVCFAAPGTLQLPRAPQAFDVELFDRIEPALKGADVVMLLRLQAERIVTATLPSLADYSRSFGLTQARLRMAKPDALVMHPGPINRGVEIESAIADSTASAVLDQVEAGVAVRSAVLAHLTSSQLQ